MPHKKKKSDDHTIVNNSMTNYKVGLYLRLSSEEIAMGEKLKNQQNLLQAYVDTQSDLEIVDVYIDNGEKGTDFDRPEWKRLMKDIKQNRISCIVVKDLSRFGRNYIETGNYLEVVFPFLQIRFIAVNDKYDTATLSMNALQPLDVIIKGIVNEVYAKEISRKIFEAKELQRKKGLFYGNIPPYGYSKNPANPYHLIVNHETSPIVKLIFQWKLNKLTNSYIANQLNDMGIPAPMRYQFLKGTVQAKRFEFSVWKGITIKVILSNRTYTGDLAMGKKRKNLSNNLVKVQAIPYKDWVIIKDTHEAIIDLETFFAVQQICMQERKIILPLCKSEV